jgi:hypothetical protein
LVLSTIENENFGMNIKFQLRLARIDLWVMLERLGPTIFIGIEDPTKGLQNREIEHLREKSLKRLFERGVIEKVDGGSKFIINNLDTLDLLGTVLNPAHSVLVSVIKDHCQPKTNTFHYGNKETIISVEQLDEDDILLSHCVREQVSEHVVSLFADCEFEQMTDDLIPLEFHQSAWNNILELMQNHKEQDALNILLETSVKGFMAKSLLLAIYKPDINMGIAVFANRNQTGYPVKPLGILAHGKYLWTIEASNQKQDTVIIKHVSKENLLNRITTLLP